MEEEFDKLKTKVLKYVLYKKRTENEIRCKFAEENENMLDDVISYLKEAKYINDEEYVKKAVKEYMNLKNLSIKEIEYKLQTKGINKNLISDYIYENKNDLVEYELKSAETIVNKKRINNEDDETIKLYLLKKGYMEEIIKSVLC